MSEPKVSREGGDYGAGYIKGFAVITAGVEALGHGAWVDDHFAGQVGQQLKAAEKGIKSRFTHPGMSADSLSKGLGRVKFVEMSNGVLRGDLHFWQSSTKGPDGDLREFLVSKAEEDPESFGASIAFARDPEAEDEFYFNNTNPATGSFQSPDPANTENYPHVRLGQLRFVDIVDDPAANPDGLFHRDQTFEEADQLMAFALGLSDTKPEGDSLGVDADRLLGFASKFLNSRGLQIVKLNFAEGEGNKPSEETQTEDSDVEDTEQTTTEPADDQPDPAPETDESEGSDDEPGEGKKQEGHFKPEPSKEEESSEGGHFSMKDLDRYCESFGDERGLAYFRAGLKFEDAVMKFNAELRKENETLRKQAELNSQSEDTPLSGSVPGGKESKGFASKINLS